MRYKAFISYSHDDEAEAKRLHHRLERFRPPKGLELADGSRPVRLYPIFRDRDETAASPSLPTTIEVALQSSQHLIVLCSPAAAASEWVNAEIRLFADIASPEQIFPLIVGGDPLSCFPPALLELLDDPLAPDLREGMDGFNDGTLKLIAGLWGMPFSTLKNRDAAWRRRRAQLNLLIAAAIGGLAVFAVLSAWRAEEQKQLAESEAKIAEARSLASLARFTLDRNPGEASVAAMVAVQSLAQSDTPEAKSVLRDALTRAPLGANVLPFPWRSPRTAISDDAKVTAFLSAYASDQEPAYSEIVTLAPDLTERSRLPFEGLAVPVFSVDGTWMAIAGKVRRLLIQRVDTREIVLDQPITSGASVAFSESGNDLYAATQLGEILRWRAGQQIAESLTAIPTSGSRLALPQLAISADGQWLLHSERGKQSNVISTANGTIRTLPFSKVYVATGFMEHEPAGALVQASDGHVLTYDSFNNGTLWDVESMQTLWTFNDQRNYPSRKEANVISADGKLFARGYINDGVVLRNMADGADVREYSHGGDVLSVQFIDGARRLATGGEGGVSIWNLAADEVPIRCAVDVYVTAMVVETGKETLLLGTSDGRLIRCDPATGKILAERRFRGQIESIAIAPDGLAVSLKLSAMSDNWTEIAFVNNDTGKTVHRSINEPFDDIKLSADGTSAATRSWLKSDVAIWDTAAGEIVSRIKANGTLVGFASDGERLLMQGDSLAVFDVESGERVMNLGESAGVRSISSQLDDTLLITDGDTESGREHWGWNAQSGERLWRVPGAAAIAPDGEIYAIDDRPAERLVVMNRALNDEIGWIPFSGKTLDVALGASGSRLIASRRTQDAEGHYLVESELWDVQSRTRLWKRQRSINAGPQQFVSLTKERALFVEGTLDNDQGSTTQLEILDWESGETVFQHESTGFESAFWVVGPDHRELLLTLGGETMLLDMSNGAKLWTVPDEFKRGMAFTPDGAHVIAVRSFSEDKNEIVVLDRRNGVEIGKWTVDEQVMDVAVTSDSKQVLSALRDDNWNGIKAWRIDNLALVYELEMDAAPRMLVPLQVPHELIVMDFAGVVRVFDLRDGRSLRRFHMSISAGAGKGAFSADGQRAYTVVGSRIRLWNTESGIELATLATKGEVSAFAVSHDGKKIAFVSRRMRTASNGAISDVVEIWEPESGEDVVTLPTVDPLYLAYDPTDSVIAIRSGKGMMRVVDADTLSPRFTIRTMVNGEWPYANETIFSRDGAYLAQVETADYGQGNITDPRAALRIFDIKSGAELARFDISRQTVTPAFASGFIYVDNAGRVRHFDTGVQSLDQLLAVDSAVKVLPVPNSDQLMLSNGWGGNALIDIATGERIDLIASTDDEFTNDSAVDSTGRYVATLTQYSREEERGSKIQVFDAKTGDELAGLQRAELKLGNIEFARSGEMIVVSQVAENAVISNGEQTGALFTWYWRDDQFQPLINDNLVSGFAVSADGESLVTSEGSQEWDSEKVHGRLQSRQVRLADRSVGTPLPRASDMSQISVSSNGKRFGLFSHASPISGAIYNTHGDTLRNIAIQDAAFYASPLGFIQDSDLFVIGERSGARIINISTGTVRRMRVPGRARHYALSGDNAFIAIGGDEFVSIWDLATFERVADLQVAGLRAIAFAGSDARALIAVTRRGVERLEWDPTALIKIACKTYRNDNWESGRSRITASEAKGLCSENPCTHHGRY